MHKGSATRGNDKELQRKLPDLTQATLTKRLRSLEEYGLVHREIYKQIPPKVEYSYFNKIFARLVVNRRMGHSI